MKIEQLESFRAKFLMVNAIKDGVMQDYGWLTYLEAMGEKGQFMDAVSRFKGMWIESEIAEIKRLSDELKQITEAISGVQDVIYKKILEYRYIKGLNMKQIERKMNMSNKTVWRYFEKAIQAIGIQKSGETDEQEHRSNQ